ncbi:unnamed protein product [Gongylonema pulchrum]|uniref:Ovule protein n=1 Tax=Gongylonema pulchrum TaxID=637853 RepID=A0A183ETN6_9BILA|nr:unnamed protein product [Gongylonema pulchrum]
MMMRWKDPLEWLHELRGSEKRKTKKNGKDASCANGNKKYIDEAADDQNIRACLFELLSSCKTNILTYTF